VIRAVLFDLDGTLYDRDAAIRRTAYEQFEAVHHSLPSVEASFFVERLVEMDGHGYSRPRRMHHVLAESLGWGVEVGDRLEECFRGRMESDTLPALDALRAIGLKLGIVTNGPVEWQSRKIRAMNIESLFDAILISESEGVQKPDVRIFQRALQRCGVEAHEALFVGDHPENDIAGAEGAGICPVWKRMPYWEVPAGVARIDRLSELLPMVLTHDRCG
jgi:putative hydrolase of the HAD superfamily